MAFDSSLLDPVEEQQGGFDPSLLQPIDESAAQTQTATTAPSLDIPQIRAYRPTLRQRAADALHALRTSQPVETLLGRTEAEKAAIPALESVPTTSDAGVMGLFTNKKQIIPRVDQPKTVMQGVQNLASEIADSVASPGGVALMAGTGGGSAVATAEEQFAARMAPVVKKLTDLGFRAQGVKMVVDTVRQNINDPNMTPGQLIENIGNALIGTGMAGRAFKAKIKPTTQEAQNALQERIATQVPVGQAPGDSGSLGAREIVSNRQEGIQAPEQRVAETRPVEQRPLEVAQEPGGLTEPALEDLPPPEPGTVRLFSGGNSSFATTNPARAARYGDVRYVDVPEVTAKTSAAAALKYGTGTEGDHLLPNDWVKRQQPVAVPKPEAPELVPPGETVSTPISPFDQYQDAIARLKSALPDQKFAIASELEGLKNLPASPEKGNAPKGMPPLPPVPPEVEGMKFIGKTQPAGNIPEKWMFNLTEPGKETTVLVPAGSTAESIAAKRDSKLQEFADAESAAAETKQPVKPVVQPREDLLPSEKRDAGQQWDSTKVGTRVRWLRSAGYVTRDGKLNSTAAKWAESRWNTLSDAAQNVLGKEVAKDFPNVQVKPVIPSPAPSENAPTGAVKPASIAGERTAPGAAKELQFLNERASSPALAEVGPGVVGMGGDVPHPRPQDFGTTGAGQDIYGVADRVRKARAAAGQVAPIPTGQGVSDVEAVKWGQELERSGADAEKSMQNFERTKAISFDGMALARGHGETLAAVARNAESKFGTDSPGYRAAQKSLSDWDARSKAMQTEWHKIGMAQQGETDIDTGSFTGINRAFRETTGRDLNPSEARTAKKLVADVNAADKATEPAKKNLQTAIDGVSEKGKPVKVAADLESQRKAFGDYKSGRPMTPLQVKTLWTRAKTEYIDKGNNRRPDIVHNLAFDFRLPVKDIMRGLEQTKPVSRSAADVWQKQHQAQLLKQFAKNWVAHAQETALQKLLPATARTLFTMKTGLHGTVALGTHAPLVVATHPIIFKNNFGRMYHLAVSPKYYEMQQYELARRMGKNGENTYNIGQEAGLVNDMSKMEDFSDPALAQGFPKMAAWFKERLNRVHLGRAVGVGTRGYSVLKILRQDLFDQAWNKIPPAMKFLEEGKRVSPQGKELAQAIADSVNHITGVTKTGGGVVGKYAHYALFAPKLEASRVAVIATDPVRAFNSLLKMKNMTETEKWFATNQFKEKASIFAVFTGLLLANQQLNNLFGDKKKINGIPAALGGGGWNPMQSDFMKFRVAGMNFAWGSPFLTMTRLPLRIYQIGAGTGGKTRFLIYPDESMYKTAGSYLRTQASPFASPVVSLITKGDYQDRPLPQIPGYGQPPPVPKRLAAEGVKPYTWKEFGTGIVLPIPFEEGMNEVFHYYDLGQTTAARNALLKAAAITFVMAGTGGRVAEDWNKSPAQTPGWSPNP